MRRRLIVNGDDYGRFPEVSRGIRDAHNYGILTSTTTMMNMPSAERDLQIALEEAPGLGLGVHLVLTCGQPLLPASSVYTLVDAQGTFLQHTYLLQSVEQVDPLHARAEWHRQIEKFISVTGKKPTHLDSHHHSSYFSVPLFAEMLALALEFDLPIRLPRPIGDIGLDGLPLDRHQAYIQGIDKLMAGDKPRTPDALVFSFYDDGISTGDMLKIMSQLGPGSTEVMCHPGYVTEALVQGTSYASQRAVELATLTSREVKEAISELGIELITFDQL
ncbi:MAG: ChbG/HpnK family deacetylase [Chloroflexota bacterium]